MNRFVILTVIMT